MNGALRIVQIPQDWQRMCAISTQSDVLVWLSIIAKLVASRRGWLSAFDLRSTPSNVFQQSMSLDKHTSENAARTDQRKKVKVKA
jgi:hypothetical protein